jgi:hypothetical protein
MRIKGAVSNPCLHWKSDNWSDTSDIKSLLSIKIIATSKKLNEKQAKWQRANQYKKDIHESQWKIKSRFHSWVIYMFCLIFPPLFSDKSKCHPQFICSTLTVLYILSLQWKKEKLLPFTNEYAKRIIQTYSVTFLSCFNSNFSLWSSYWLVS